MLGLAVLCLIRLCCSYSLYAFSGMVQNLWCWRVVAFWLFVLVGCLSFLPNGLMQLHVVLFSCVSLFSVSLLCCCGSPSVDSHLVLVFVLFCLTLCGLVVLGLICSASLILSSWSQIFDFSPCLYLLVCPWGAVGRDMLAL